MFVLATQTSFGIYNEYYLGETYIYQGSYYPSIGRLDEAKNYKSRKLAENALKTLSNKVGETFIIKEFD